MRTALLVSVTALTLGRPAVSQQPPAPAPAAAPGDAKPENLCSLEGKIVHAGSGEPLSKATLMMRRADVPNMMSGPPAVFTTTSGADGRFAMKDIEPGTYHLSVMRTGFLRTDYGSRGPGRSGTTLKLEAGQKMSSVDFKLTPHGVITGRIVDEDGEPLAYVQVSTLRHRYMQGHKQLTPMGMASTNDLGEFRIFGVAPGRYYLSATIRSQMMFGMMQDRSAAGQSDESYLPTYFPGTTDPAAASTFDLTGGQHVSGIEMRLSKARSLRLRGRVNNTTGVKARDMMVNLTPRDTMGFYNSNRAVASGPQSSFEFRGLSAGAYTLFAQVMDGQTMYTGRQDVDLGADPIDNLVITVAQGLVLAGDVSAAGPAGPAGAKADLTGSRVFLTSADAAGMNFGGPSDNRVKEDGSFALTNVQPAKYYLRIYGLPDGYYLKSARLGNQPVVDDLVDLTSGSAAPLHITVAEGAAQIEGSVSNDRQEPTSGATVVLIPEKESMRERQEYVKSASTDQHGRFTIKNLDPGDYRIYAWEDIESGAWMDPDVLKPVESKATKLTLKERAKESVELHVIRNE